MQLSLDQVDAAYDANTVLHGLSLTVDSGQIGCLLGPSGCGKTTALRCVAGFETIASGTISIGDQCVSGQTLHVPAEKRGVGMVFQDYALLPHLTVLRNVLFGLHKTPPHEANNRAHELLNLVGLSHAENNYPNQLSGGEQQRVALARALAPGPRVLLMDEPFSNLDSDLRARLSGEVRQIIKQLGITTLLVTHDQQEAFALADVVTIMQQGRGEQTGKPLDLYHRPKTKFVANFVGIGSFLRGVVVDDEVVETVLGRHTVRNGKFSPGTKVDVLFRPEDLVMDSRSPISGSLVRRTFRGRDTLLCVMLPTNTTVLCFASNTVDLEQGVSVNLSCRSDDVMVFGA